MLLLWILFFISSHNFVFGAPGDSLPPPPLGPNGVQLTLSASGVHHLTSKMAENLVEKRLKNTKFADFSRQTFTHDVFLTNLKISRMEKPKKNQYEIKLLTSSNKIFFKAKNLRFVLTGDLAVRSRFFPKFMDAFVTPNSKVYINVDGLILDLSMTLFRGHNGYPRLGVNGCQANVRSLTADKYSPKMFQQAMKNREARFMVQSMICQNVATMVENLLPSIFKRQPLILHMTRVFPKLLKSLSSLPGGIKTGSLAWQLDKIIRKSSLDLRLTAHPEFRNYGSRKVSNAVTALFMLKGDVLWKNDQSGILEAGDIPFKVPRMGIVEPAQKMAYLSISDHVINSLFYQAFKNQALKMTIDSKKDLQATASMFLDSFLSLEDSQVSPTTSRLIDLSAFHCPAVHIGPKSIDLFADVDLTVSNFDGRIKGTILKILINIEADIKFQIPNRNNTNNQTTINLSLKMKKVRAALIESKIQSFDQNRADQVADIISMLIEGVINAKMAAQGGLTLPKMNFIVFSNLDLQLNDRFITMGADFDVKMT